MAPVKTNVRRIVMSKEDYFRKEEEGDVEGLVVIKQKENGSVRG